MPVYRRAAIVGLKIVWNAIKKLTTIKNRGSISSDDLVSELISSGHFVNAIIASNVVQDAVDDGLIVKSEDGFLQLPPTNCKTTQGDDVPDWYCYECHSGGDVNKCERCLRVFHVSCIMTDSDKQELWDKVDYHIDKQSKTLLKYKEPEQVVDVTKNIAIGDESKLRRFCYGCRLMHKGRTVSEMSKEELHYLLTFVFNRVNSWIKSDTFSLQDESLPKAPYIMNNVELSVSNLLRFPTTIATLKTKLENLSYSSLEEFLRDILDIGHNLALVFGRHSAEYEATNYLFADAQFEIGEIKTCRDCYRHSNEKFDDHWFTIPCASRSHELVYAKAPGFSYWPAKVVKINEDGKYDVRFFGSEHSRAIISAKNIESIEKNLRRLNNGNKLSGTLQQAVNELQEYLKRLKEPLNLFTFEAEKDIRENNTCKFVPNNPTTPLKKKRIRRSKSTSSSRQSLERSESKNTTKEKSSTSVQQKKETNEAKSQTVDKTPKVTPFKPEPQKKDPPLAKPSPKKKPVQVKNVQKSPPPVGPAPKRVKLERERLLKEEAEKTIVRPNTSVHNNHKKEAKHPALQKLESRLMFAKSVEEAHQVAIVIMQEELECFQKKIKLMEEKHHEDIRVTKENQWCRSCYDYANYYCCWNTSYCSRECQRDHWDGHKLVCKRINSGNKNNGASSQ